MFKIVFHFSQNINWLYDRYIKRNHNYLNKLVWLHTSLNNFEKENHEDGKNLSDFLKIKSCSLSAGTQYGTAKEEEMLRNTEQ